jgi:hypothetical protein
MQQVFNLTLNTSSFFLLDERDVRYREVFASPGLKLFATP